MRDRVTTIFRRPSPELLEALESADKELKPAIAECEQRRHRLVALRDEGRSLLAELQEQIQANLQAASEAMQQVETADSDDARENALAKKKACDEHVAVLQAQSHELGERLDELELQLAKADADLVTLQSRQGAVQGRIAVVKRPPRRLPMAALIVTVVLLAGLMVTPFIWRSLKDDSGTEASKGTEGGPPPLAIAPFDAEQARRHQENWAKYLGVPVEKEIDLGGGQKLTMDLIPPGEFLMGSTQAELIRFLEEAKAAGELWAIDAIPREGPQHRVRITKPFWLGRSEVTRRQFRRFVEIPHSKLTPNATISVELDWSTELGSGTPDSSGVLVLVLRTGTIIQLPMCPGMTQRRFVGGCRQNSAEACSSCRARHSGNTLVARGRRHSVTVVTTKMCCRV